MRNRNTNHWSMAVLIAVFLAAWTGSAVAQGRGGPPSKDQDREPPSAVDFIQRLEVTLHWNMTTYSFGHTQHCYLFLFQYGTSTKTKGARI